MPDFSAWILEHSDRVGTPRLCELTKKIVARQSIVPFCSDPDQHVRDVCVSWRIKKGLE